MCQQGEQDRDPFGAQRIHRIFRVLLSQTHDPHTADDLTQELFLEVLRVRSRFDPRRGTVDAWINGFVPLILMRHWSRVGKRRAREAEAPEEQEDARATDLIERLAWHDHVRRAIDRLAPRDRELLLRFGEGQSVREIAEALGMSISAVTTALMRARERLRTLLEQDGTDPQTA